MKAADIQQLQIDSLRLLHAAGEIGLRAPDLLVRLRTTTFPALTEPELNVELLALADRGWVVSYAPALGAARWKITGLGTAALKEAGLA